MKTLWAATALALVFAVAGCKASKPGKIESTVMDGIKRNITVGGKDWKNPIPYTPEAAKEGEEHFQHHCQICHGRDGQNTGVPFATKMDPPVADLASSDIQKYADGQLKWIIENGITPSGMPGWKGTVEDDEMWKMVHFIRHLPARGSLGAPPIYKEEEEEHHAMEHVKASTGDHHSHGDEHKH